MTAPRKVVGKKRQRGGRPPKSGITEQVREFLVVAAARYLTPTQAAEAANERFGTALIRQDAAHYNPERSQGGRKIAAKWHLLFAETRKKHLDHIDAIPIANRAMRLEQLNTLYFAALGRRDFRHAAELLERASKEAGNYHSNESTVRVQHGGKIAVEDVSEEEMRCRIADALAEAWEKKPPVPPPGVTAH